MAEQRNKVRELKEKIKARNEREEQEQELKSKTNSKLQLVGKILYWLLFVLTLMILIVVLMQRFSNNTFALGGFRIFNVITESMLPDYEVGDVLLSKEKDVSQIEIGEDVVYNGTTGSFEGKIVTHRVVSVRQEDGQYKFITKGIANEEEDPEITGDQIMGVVTYKIKSISFISHIIHNLYSFYFIVFVPLAVLVFIEVRKIVSNFIKK